MFIARTPKRSPVPPSIFFHLRMILFGLTILVSVSFGATPYLAFGQQPLANDEIANLIKDGMPETVVINKINASAGHLDDSADALIALKAAGATPAELTAMTEAHTTGPASNRSAPTSSIGFAGGTLLRNAAGDPYIQFPERQRSVFPNGEFSNRAWLISFLGKPAIRIPAERLIYNGGNISGNLIISHDQIIFDPYLVEHGWGEYPKNGKYIPRKDAWKFANEKGAFSLPRPEVKLHYKNWAHLERATLFSDKSNYYYVGLHINGDNLAISDIPPLMSPQLEQFVRDMILDFDSNMQAFQTLSQTQDVNVLSHAAQYTRIKEEDFPKYAAIYQSQLDHLGPPTKNGGGFLTDLGTALQVVGAGATALQQSEAGGNTPQAQATAMMQYNQTVSRIVAGDSAAVPTPYSSQSATGSLTGGGLYSGPHSEWVRKVLTTVGPYSCTPSGKPKVPASFTCQRDAEIYKAQLLAWGAECTEQTGSRNDAVADANVLVQTLRNTKSLCGALAPTGPVRCDTDLIMPCSQLPN